MKMIYLLAGVVAVSLGGFIWWHEVDAARTRMIERPLLDLRRPEGLTTRCRACEGVVSREAKTCPHCGHPQ